jgi:16S rRNA (guanine527-N7)-methyltransferase
LVLACALAERPGACVHLVDNNVRRAAFLREVTRALKIPAIVHCERIEDFIARDAETPDVVTARALAPLDRLAGLIYPLLKKGARALLMKGQDVEVELTEASKCWNIMADLVPSRTHPGARIVIVTSLEPR